MNKKSVLVVDEDKARLEKLLFIIRLGGYETQTFGSLPVALNWIKYGSAESEDLCLVFNSPGEFHLVEEIVAAWSALGKKLPIILLQRGQAGWNRHLALDAMDPFFVCEPESLLQSLEVLTAISTKDTGVKSGEYAGRMNVVGGRGVCRQ